MIIKYIRNCQRRFRNSQSITIVNPKLINYCITVQKVAKCCITIKKLKCLIVDCCITVDKKLTSVVTTNRLDCDCGICQS